MKKILGVVRASTDHQEIISQKQELATYIISNGFNEAEIEWLEVQGASARKANKEYLDLLQSIKDHIMLSDTIKSVAFWHLNRLGRIDTYLIDMKNWFIENKIQVYVKNPSLTLLDPDGKVNAGAEIAWGVYATMVKQETQEMFAKIARGKNRNKENGIYNGGTVLFGCKVDPITKKVIPNNEEIEVLHILFTEYSKNKLSTYLLAKEMNDRGITQRGKKITGQWVQRILTTTAMRSIVGEELYDLVQSIVRSRNVNRKTKHIHIAGGLVRCPLCGCRMFAESKGYKCYNHYNQNRNDTSISCSFTAKLSTKIIDNLAFEIAMVGYADYMSVSNQEALEEYQNELMVNRQKIEENKRRLEKLDSKRERIKSLYVDGDITKKEYDKMKLSVKSENESLLEDNDFLGQKIIDLQLRIQGIKDSGDFDRILKAFNDKDVFDEKEAYDVVHKFINTITFYKIKNGLYHITITDIKGYEWKFKYLPYDKKGNELYDITGGVEVRYKLKKRF